ncbi:RdgB/HAM1 family non-canonical purine NTP pyrophosphatase [Bremerella alba]|uniref:dITP/XTP pyrophosphatase n=1 Tax=Bremerella alba TaxID=980252 RepID=A0A7V8V644_9BACT|nr:RdgB/HAM1 family non-canonical purine NTP pyrophosphatase [Bremerella alba]MBA2115630.1 dITP/XTP pyrophosphatase [Bremerella alba]
MSDNRPMVLGTYNQKKRSELQRLLLPLDIQLKTLEEYPAAIEVVEDGTSFAENAAKKATQQAITLGEWVLAEDSGLCVDALKGAPGIYSARFSGEDATDEKNNDLLLEKLADLPPEKRGAHYVCHIVLANPEGEVVLIAEDKCHGRIVRKRRGTNGFGYDPLFELREYHRTFGEMGPAIKSLISHRAKASRAFVEKLRVILAKNRALFAQEKN